MFLFKAILPTKDYLSNILNVCDYVMMLQKVLISDVKLFDSITDVYLRIYDTLRLIFI